MTHNHPPHKLDEQQLEDRLARFQPQPGPDFQARMESMPWRTETMQERHQIRHLMTVLAAAFALLIVGTLTVAPLRSLAQELWDSFFERADNNTQPYDEPVIPAQFTPTPVYTPQAIADPMTFDEARTIVPFAIKEPNLGEQYRLIGMAYKPDESLFLIAYARNGMLLQIEQMPLDAAQPERIGPDAVIREVQVGDYNAEYVEGYWASEMGEVDGQTAIEGEVWVDTPNAWRMSWTDGMVFYRLSNSKAQAWYENIFSLDEIIAVAESLETGVLVDDFETAPQVTPTPVP